jgi:hypothetical protein
MKLKRNSNLATLLAVLSGSLGAYSLCAGAEDKGTNERLLTVIRDTDARTVKALLSEGADANA